VAVPSGPHCHALLSDSIGLPRGVRAARGPTRPSPHLRFRCLGEMARQVAAVDQPRCTRRPRLVTALNTVAFVSPNAASTMRAPSPWMAGQASAKSSLLRQPGSVRPAAWPRVNALNKQSRVRAPSGSVPPTGFEPATPALGGRPTGWAWLSPGRLRGRNLTTPGIGGSMGYEFVPIVVPRQNCHGNRARLSTIHSGKRFAPHVPGGN
jgi:hypothetical protein